MITAELFPKTDSYRPIGGWCKVCLKVLFDCGGEGRMTVGRVKPDGRVHFFRMSWTRGVRVFYVAGSSICGRVQLPNYY